MCPGRVGCGGGQSATSTAPSTTSTPEPTTTTIPPLTAEEVAWLDGLTELKETLQKKRDKILAAATTGLTRPLMVLLGLRLGSCSRELARLGSPPGDRLQPVYALTKKACQQLAKAAQCQATMASLSDPRGSSPAVGSPQHRLWKRAGDCADAAEQKGMKLFEDAHAKGTEIQIIAAVGHD